VSTRFVAAVAVAVLLVVGCSQVTELPADTDVPAGAASMQPTAPTPVLSAPPRYMFPVTGPASFVDVHHDYPAADVFAECGTPVVAPTGATVVGVNRLDQWAPGVRRAMRGGLSVTLVGDDGVRYYSSHLRSVDRAVTRGAFVAAGQRIGRVGHTGNAAGTECHLHLGISPVCQRDRDWWVRRGVVPPYPFLRAWQRGDQLSPRRSVMAWQRRHGCPPSPPRGY
jgi:murein DD-endopeptidase MepM/ murein hydrolase activator NlpD